jgi:2-polyprenyl-3-methyl-5-hydroxy-6-metoxy-1,4-benzoquinol methylase
MRDRHQSLCNLCDFDVCETLYEIETFKKKFSIVICPSCGLIFQHPQPVDVDELYNEGYYSGSSEYSYIDEREDKFLRDIESRRRIQNIEKFFPYRRKPLRILDVGCSFGNLIQNAIDLGHDAYGLDVSEYVKQNGHSNIARGNVCDPIDGYYDVITMAETIEHLRDPKRALLNCHDALNPNGILLIQTTNMDSITRRFEGKNSRYFLPGHLFYFSIRTLERMLESTGFKIEKIYYGHETGLVPAIIRKAICNMGRFSCHDFTVLCYTILMHAVSRLHIGRLAIHNGMVVIARRAHDGRTVQRVQHSEVLLLRSVFA